MNDYNKEFYKECFKLACRTCEALDMALRDNHKSDEEYEKSILEYIDKKQKRKPKKT